MHAILAVGGPGPELTPSWDFWLPAYVFLSLVLIVLFVRPRVTVWTGIACLASGALWDWLSHAIGVVPAAAIVVLVAVIAGAVFRRIAPLGRGRRAS